MTMFVEGRDDAAAASLYGIEQDALEVHRLRAARLLVRAVSTAGSEPVLPLPEETTSSEERRCARLLTARLGRAPVTPGGRPPPAMAAGEGGQTPAEHARTDASAAASTIVETSARLLERLRELAAQVQATAEAEAVAWEHSPQQRRAELIRRIALAALIAVAAWLYFRNNGGPG